MSRSRGPEARDPQAGVTLIEILVVLAIVAVGAGASMLALGALDGGSRAGAEALRLADRLRLAADEAMVTAAPLALQWDARGYRFLAWDAREAVWREAPQDLLGAAHRLPAALTLAREDAATPDPVLITPDLPQPPVVLRLAGGAADWRVSFDGFAAAATPAGP